MKIKKNIQKCVRMRQSTYDYILSFEGDGFNEKFQNACNYFSSKQEELDKLVEWQNRRLEELDKSISDRLMMSRNIDSISMYLDYCADIVSRDMPNLLPDQVLQHKK